MALALSLGAISPIHAMALQYRAVVVGEYGDRYAAINDINDSNEAVGYIRDGEFFGDGMERAFHFDLSSGTFTDLHELFNLPGSAVGTQANAINESGVIAGLYDAANVHNPLVYDRSQASGSDVVSLGYGHWNSRPRDINEDGRVLLGPMRYVDYADGAASDPVVIGEFGDFDSTFDINDAGMIVGEARPSGEPDFLFAYDSAAANPEIIDLNSALEAAFGSGTGGNINDLNQHGEAIGNWYRDGVGHGFVLDVVDQSVTQQLTPGRTAIPFAMNDHGDIVGWVDETPDEIGDFDYRPAFFVGDEALYLDTRVTGLPEGYSLSSVGSINNQGVLAGGAGGPGADVLFGGPSAGVLLLPELPATLDGADADLEFDLYGHEGDAGFAVTPGDPVPQLFGGTLSVENLQIGNGFYTLSLPYDAGLATALGLDEYSLRLYWLDAVLDDWVLAGDFSNLMQNPDAAFVLGAPTNVYGDWGLDVAGSRVWANVDHASRFGIAGVSETAAVPLPGTLALLLAGLLPMSALLKHRQSAA